MLVAHQGDAAMQIHPDFHYDLAKQRHAEALAQAANERRAAEGSRAAPDFIAASRRRDAAFWSLLVGPILGIGFLTYFAQVIASSAA
jgi:hypothetical protein